MSEWVREVLLRELDGKQARPAEETVLAEVLALRTILLNAFYRLAEGEKLTAEELQSFIDRARAPLSVWEVGLGFFECRVGHRLRPVPHPFSFGSAGLVSDRSPLNYFLILLPNYYTIAYVQHISIRNL
jgi:hypothetical protein